MHRRCDDDEHPSYEDYGARGIYVSDVWDTYEAFIETMGYRPEGTQLDRIDSNGIYEPRNCRWVTPKQNQNNRKNTKFFTLNGITKCCSEWAESIGLTPKQLNARVFAGWSLEKALTTPLMSSPIIRN